jgi:serine phosphatase RsbU (regulator of sigma subunit)
MNKEEIFEIIKAKLEEQKEHQKQINNLTEIIKLHCLQILKNEKGIEIGSEFYKEKDSWNSETYFKITKIDSHVYSGIGSEITYSLRGTPKKKDCEYSKREMFIKNVSVYFTKGLNQE